MILLSLIVKLLWIGRKGVVFFIFFLLACPVFGQVGKLKDLTPVDYEQWHNMLPHQISPDGKWATYSLYYPQTTDTLFLLNTQNGQKFSIPRGNKQSFSSDGKWCLIKDINNKLSQVNLTNGTQVQIREVIDFEITADSQFIVYLQKTASPENQRLIVKRLGEKIGYTIENVTEFQLNKEGSYLAYINSEGEGNKLFVQSLLDQKTSLIKVTKVNNFKNLVWSLNGNGLAFYEMEVDGNINVFWIQNWRSPSEVKVFNSNRNGLEICGSFLEPIIISKDNENIFFRVRRQEIKSSKEPELIDNQIASVEVWNTKDEFLYPAYQKLKHILQNPDMTVSWNLETEEWHLLGNTEQSMTEIRKGSPYAFSYSVKDYILAANDKAPASEILVNDIESGDHKSILEKPFGMEFQISPSGRYLVYFKENNWWCYDALNDSHSNLTQNLQHSFLNTEDTRIIPFRPYGLAGWTINEAEVLIYDKFDIWAITPNGNKTRKITNGRSEKIRFRLYNYLNNPYKDFNAQLYDFTNGIIVKARSLVDERTGYFTYNNNVGLEKIVFKDSFVSNLRLADDGNSVIYTQERYDSPPQLMFLNLKQKKPILLQQSNPQHFKYNWGKSELVYYTSQKDSLKGILYYPSNFNPQIKYPMVTYYYEEMAENLHKYISPSMYEEHGFNISNYTTKGYFVFCPDIVYEIGNPGISAVACIIDGVNKVIKNKFIDNEKIGAYGHSWGGYETMFLITQTNMFATAVAGSGISDLRSLYLSMAWMWDVPQSYRFESYSIRLGTGYYNAREAYERNSPIVYAQNINIPFLSWVGKLDTNTNWEQTVELFLALRKLGKEHIMLLYQDEGHLLNHSNNAKDLTLKMQDWFDHYLRGKTAKKWIKEYH
ncbi:prolyl oligopeptidase family serine peptidase [Aequorivita sp. F47161]|uniref:Prolyl oligopeptidase family serine peptidase n=1 Tax=Aequorivita vitellina TaxID=2874475 RepID=A0A9X1U1J0_9FLAO|nr:prolyl oligopeptidase family serine peptidase [Aequorivita vitellina]MCG2419749.1 prolyl oligopeptidase family serine peptidase [Aequorivita vitellina]